MAAHAYAVDSSSVLLYRVVVGSTSARFALLPWQAGHSDTPWRETLATPLSQSSKAKPPSTRLASTHAPLCISSVAWYGYGGCICPSAVNVTVKRSHQRALAGPCPCILHRSPSVVGVTVLGAGGGRGGCVVLVKARRPLLVAGYCGTIDTCMYSCIRDKQAHTQKYVYEKMHSVPGCDDRTGVRVFCRESHHADRRLA